MSAAALAPPACGRARRPHHRGRTRHPPACALGDPHRVLGVEPGADAAAIKKAFRRLALRHHPDVSHDAHAEAQFQAIQAAYDELLHRHTRHGEGALARGTAEARWQRARRAEEGAEAEAAHTVLPSTPAEQQSRWKAQLGGLASRSAHKERREAEQKYRAAMREHATRGSFSGCASTDAGRERLQGQLSTLWQHAAAQPALRPEAASHHLLSLSAGVAQAEQPAAAAQPSPPLDSSPPQGESAEELTRLLRLARVARSWREATGSEPPCD